MNDKQRLIALHSLIPWPWNRLKPIFDTLQHHSTLTTPIPQIVQEQWTKAQTFPFEAFYTKHSITLITIFDTDYPEQLKNLHDPPAVLYIRGNPSLLKSAIVAIIGSRKSTHYSEHCINSIMPFIKLHTKTVCSGMAIGADTMAHQAAIAHETPTIAILGSGFHQIYPKTNHKLFEEMVTKHLVITEYPPQTMPAPHQFIARNRLISGLSQAVIITQAEKKSGTMSTVDFALDLGKEVYTFPGKIDSVLSEGPHSLIQQGAILLHSSADFTDSFVLSSQQDK
ncbi:DNA-processing protein DprA [Chryseomicrobium sp. FSL W7-1435]|uniref:DNA-processing protein DprA n=1 Tax=Chryseomicrobium sp. FSL W7-1435 TaxID=2921704 RepID=UPI00315A360A